MDLKEEKVVISQKNMLELLTEKGKSVIFSTKNDGSPLEAKINIIYGDFSMLGDVSISKPKQILELIDRKNTILELLGADKYINNIFAYLNSSKRISKQLIPIKVNETSKVFWFKALMDNRSKNYYFSLELIDYSIFDVEKLFLSSYKDSLTGLFNSNALAKHIDNNNNHHFFGYFDIDGFKQINDKFSHSAGDDLLKKIGQKLINIANEKVIFYRKGGDEFVFMTIDLSLKETRLLVEKIHHELSQIRFAENFITFSIGVCEYNNNCEYSIKEAIEIADIGMYQAKRKGKNTTVFISIEDATKLISELSTGNYRF